MSRTTKPWTEQVVWIHLTKARAGDLWNQWVTCLFSTLRAIRFSNSVSFSIPLYFQSRERGGGSKRKSAQVTALWWKTLLKAGTCPGVGVEMDDELNTATFWLWPRPGSFEEEIFARLPSRAGWAPGKSTLSCQPNAEALPSTAHVSTPHVGIL